MDAAQAGVPAALPLPVGVRHDGVAGGHVRSLGHGSAARALLPGLLLASDAAAVRRRHHERPLDRRSRPLRPDREGGARRALDWTGRRRPARRPRDRDAGFGSLVMATNLTGAAVK